MTARPVRASPARRTAAGEEVRGNLSWDQHLANLVSLANDFQLHLAVFAGDDLSPNQADKLGDAQAAQ